MELVYTVRAPRYPPSAPIDYSLLWRRVYLRDQIQAPSFPAMRVSFLAVICLLRNGCVALVQVRTLLSGSDFPTSARQRIPHLHRISTNGVW